MSDSLERQDHRKVSCRHCPFVQPRRIIVNKLKKKNNNRVRVSIAAPKEKNK